MKCGCGCVCVCLSFNEIEQGYIFGIESIINFIRWCQLSQYPKLRDVNLILVVE